MAKYQLKIKEGCIGCGHCEAVCSKTFVLKNGLSTLKRRKSLIKSPASKKAADEGALCRLL